MTWKQNRHWEVTRCGCGAGGGEGMRYGESTKAAAQSVVLLYYIFHAC